MHISIWELAEEEEDYLCMCPIPPCQPSSFLLCTSHWRKRQYDCHHWAIFTGLGQNIDSSCHQCQKVPSGSYQHYGPGLEFCDKCKLLGIGTYLLLRTAATSLWATSHWSTPNLPIRKKPAIFPLSTCQTFHALQTSCDSWRNYYFCLHEDVLAKSDWDVLMLCNTAFVRQMTIQLIVVAVD